MNLFKTVTLLNSNRASRLNHLVSRLFVVIVVGVFFVSSDNVLFAQQQTQRNLFSSGVHFYDLGTNDSCSPNRSLGPSSIPTEGDRPERTFRHLVNEGFSEAQAAGVVGNLMKESGPSIDPAASNRGSYRGIAQWDTRPGERWDQLVSWANGENKNPELFETQLEYMVLEAKARTYPGNSFTDFDGIKQQNDPDPLKEVALSAWFWGRFFEVAIIGNNRSVAPLENVQELDDRIAFGISIYQQYEGSTTGGGSDTVTVALDPGHGGEVPKYTDPVTGLQDRETTNSPEREDAQDVSNRVKNILEPSGYKVVILRTSPTQAISKRERVNAAEAAGADVVVSIHTTEGSINEVWPQRVGKYRENVDGSGDRVAFTNESVARSSEQIANTMAQQRSLSEGHPVNTDPNQTTQSSAFGAGRAAGGGLFAIGDISLVQLWSTNIPWVYNEIERDDGAAISDARKQAYAEGIANGIRESTIIGSGGGSDNCAPNQGLIGTTLSYAWPEYHAPPYTTKKPEYHTAIEAAQARGQYVGGGINPGVDCGGFVTRLLIDSGFEPSYNYAGDVSSGASNVAFGQSPWIEANWRRIGSVTSTSELQPGDVAINTGKTHTFIFVGDIPGFGSNIASSSFSRGSQGWRAPMAGRENPLSSDIIWYRIIQ